ncbi:Clp protease N-terminal domain-containing protein [Streptomyces sp. NPDC090306]|uniref:Clp protease N-terminal domain-containing protein n=1 Tax=Streptomyces sp. NPDC090306 TaxID=3365961 RepID=UPI0037F137BC
MFERFTKDARDVVDGAVKHAERTGSGRVEEVHVLLSVLDRKGSRGSFALSALGLPPDSGRRDDLVRALPGGTGTGAGAAVPGDRRRAGRRPFGKDTKSLLADSLRIAVGHHDRHIGDEHLLLALTGRHGALAGVLAGHGVTHDSVNRVLYGDDGPAAGSAAGGPGK